MSRDRDSHKTTLKLSKMLIEGTKRFENVENAIWWRNPLYTILKTRNRALRVRLDGIQCVLMVRYKGVLYQVFRRMGLTDEQLVRSQVRVWVGFRNSALTMTDARSFAKCLWELCLTQGKLGTLTLKPKLMLRQFVDEMSNSDERGVLRSLGYGSPDGYQPADDETLQLLLRAYPLLHKELLNRIEELELLTDDQISARMVNAMVEPFVDYKNWLFNS